MKVLVICVRRYNGHELWTALNAFVAAGVEFEVVSTATRIVDERTGYENRIARTFRDVDTEEFRRDFDGLMLVSGSPRDTEELWFDRKVAELVAAASEDDLPLAAICASVPAIRKAAAGHRVSFFPLVRARNLLQESGAILSTVTCSADRKIVTAEHQGASAMWVETYRQVLMGEPVTLNLVDSGFVPHGKERKPIPIVEAWKRRLGTGGNEVAAGQAASVQETS